LISGAVGCLNNDRTVMSKSYAWRPLGLLPTLQAIMSGKRNIQTTLVSYQAVTAQ